MPDFGIKDDYYTTALNERTEQLKWGVHDRIAEERRMADSFAYNRYLGRPWWKKLWTRLTGK